MYNRVGRTLLIVGRQLTQKFTKNSKNNGAIAIVCPLTNSLCGATNNHFFRRNYCDNKNVEEDDDDSNLLSLDKESTAKLKEFLVKPENERMYKIMELEIEVLRQNNEKVPEILKPRHWWEIVQLDSKSKRKRYLAFLWTLEKKKENRLNAKEQKRKTFEESPKEEKPYGLGTNTIFLRIYDSTMNQMWNSRLINRILFGQPVVLDCSYEPHMNRAETKNCARQLKLTFSENRCHDDPFNLYFCNADKSGELMKALHRYIPPMYDNDFPMNIKTESYLDIFDKDRLVYLTPHCQQEMTSFDHDAVYIIGAFVDKATNEPVSLAKAKKEGLKMMKFPLDRYLKWGCSSGKNLTLNAAMNILLDLRKTGDWEKALENVPRRKLFEVQQEGLERKTRRLFDTDSLRKATENTIPVQESQFMHKTGHRFNTLQREYRHNASLDYRSGYNRLARPDGIIKSKNDDGEKDFSMEGRTKFRKNWKN